MYATMYYIVHSSRLGQIGPSSRRCTNGECAVCMNHLVAMGHPVSQRRLPIKPLTRNGARTKNDAANQLAEYYRLYFVQSVHSRPRWPGPPPAAVHSKGTPLAGLLL